MGRKIFILGVLVCIAVFTFSEKTVFAAETDISLSENTVATLDSISIQSTDVTSGDYTYAIENGTAYIKKYNGSAYSVTIPTSWYYGGTNYAIRKVGDSAFEGNTSIHKLTIPSAITSLGKKAFANCTSLESIVINGNIGDLSYISSELYSYSGYSAFIGAGKNSSGLKVTFGNGVTRIPAYLFSTGAEKSEDEYAHITEITIADSVTEIGKYAFYRCFDISKIQWGNGITTIEERAFYDAQSLSVLALPNKLAQVKNSAFERCYSLERIYLPKSLVKIGNCSFAHCTKLQEINISGNIGDLNSISSELYSYTNYSAFSGAGVNSSKLTVIFNEGVTRIPAYLFSTGADKSVNDYAHIDEVIFPDSLITIGKYAFYHCYDIESLEWGDELTTIEEYAFAYDEGISELDFPDKLTRLGSYAFYYCAGIEDIYLPESVSRIERNTFSYCSMVSSIIIDGNIGNLSDISKERYSFESYAAFIDVGENSEDLKVTFGNNVTEIPEYLFATGADKSENLHAHITEITIPVGVKSIGKYAFYHLYDLKKITFGGKQSRWYQILNTEGNDLENVNIVFEGKEAPADDDTDPESGSDDRQNIGKKVEILKGNVVSYNGVHYYMAKTTIPFTDIFEDATYVTSSSKIVKINVKKRTIKFKRDGNATLTSDTGEERDIVVFGGKPEKAVLRVGEEYAIPESVLIETAGSPTVNKPNKATISSNGVLTALEKGAVKLTYVQNNKQRTVMKIKIKK